MFYHTSVHVHMSVFTHDHTSTGDSGTKVAFAEFDNKVNKVNSSLSRGSLESHQDHQMRKEWRSEGCDGASNLMLKTLSASVKSCSCTLVASSE